MNDLFDQERIGELIDLARARGSAQLVVRSGGHLLIDEVFAPGPVDVFAVQKGVVSLLVGMAIDRQLMNLSDRVDDHLPLGWTGLSPELERCLTIRHLMTMTTGMDDQLCALGQAGQSWRYNNTAYNYLKRILCEKTGLSLAGLTNTWLGEPLGLKETRWVDRNQRLPDGRPFTGLLSTAADLAEVGALVLAKGMHNGRQLVPSTYLSEIALPGSGENPAWGLLWWNNNQQHFRVPMREEKIHDGNIIPAAPVDLVAARGAGENHLGVIPSLGLVVARTTLPVAQGERPPAFEREFYQLLLAAMVKSGDTG